MKRSVIDAAAVDILVARVERLNASSVPLWGSMHAAEMLLHCNVVHTAVLNWNGAKGRATMRQRLMKFAWLYILPRFPRNVRTSRKFNVKGQVDQDAFSRQREEWVSLLRKFTQKDIPLFSPHPFFGPLDTEEWGRVLWKHADHHLRQFGV